METRLLVLREYFPAQIQNLAGEVFMAGLSTKDFHQ
jgi:hypothetical protein